MGALDRYGASYRQGTMVVGATAQACGEDLKKITLSKSSMHRARTKFRSTIGNFSVI